MVGSSAPKTAVQWISRAWLKTIQSGPLERPRMVGVPPGNRTFARNSRPLAAPSQIIGLPIIESRSELGCAILTRRDRCCIRELRSALEAGGLPDHGPNPPP